MTHKIARFCLSGLLAALVYWGLAVLAVRSWAWDTVAAGLFAYASSMPVAYCLHRHVSFRSRDSIGPQLLKFVLTSGVGFGLSGALPYGLVSLGVSLEVSLAMTCLLVPVVSYLLMSSWVFFRVSHG